MFPDFRLYNRVGIGNLHLQVFACILLFACTFISQNNSLILYFSTSFSWSSVLDSNGFSALLKLKVPENRLLHFLFLFSHLPLFFHSFTSLFLFFSFFHSTFLSCRIFFLFYMIIVASASCKRLQSRPCSLLAFLLNLSTMNLVFSKLSSK